MNKKENLVYSLLAITAVVFAFAAGYLTNDLVARAQAPFPLLSLAHEILSTRGITPLPADPALEYGMIRGMIEAYADPFTSFSEPAQHELQTNNLEGTFGGIGIRLERDPDGHAILYPFPDGPAARAGLLDGDRLISVDGLAITGEISFDEITAAIRGPEGAAVNIEAARAPGFVPFEVSIRREAVALPSVTWHLAAGEPRIGIVEVNLIADTTPEEIERAVADLQEQGAGYFVLDLRHNGGGLLDAGVEAARLFLHDGVVIEQQYRGEEITSFEVEAPGTLADLPLVVWVDGGTASAAEIIAGAIQSHGRAPLIGSQTFGKDVIQLVFELADKSSIQITAARWWLPGHDFPNGEGGLLADVVVEGDTGVFLEAAAAWFFGE